MIIYEDVLVVFSRKSDPCDLSPGLCSVWSILLPKGSVRIIHDRFIEYFYCYVPFSYKLIFAMFATYCLILDDLALWLNSINSSENNSFFKRIATLTWSCSCMCAIMLRYNIKHIDYVRFYACRQNQVCLFKPWRCLSQQYHTGRKATSWLILMSVDEVLCCIETIHSTKSY